MTIQMMYDEEELKFLIDQSDLPDLKEIYDAIQDIRPLKLKILKKRKCKRCGWCCTTCNTMLTKQDIIRLCTHFRCSFEDLYNTYMDKNAKMPYLTLPCPFLDSDKNCKIYHIRPKICKEFPFNEFSFIAHPCLLGKELRDIIEEREGPINKINEDMQEFADDADKMIDTILNKEYDASNKGTMHVVINKSILVALMGYIKDKERNNK